MQVQCSKCGGDTDTGFRCVKCGHSMQPHTGGTQTTDTQQRKGEICPSCKSELWNREVASGKCWNCGTLIGTTGKLSPVA